MTYSHRPHLDIMDAGQSPNAVSVHAGTTQVDFKVDRPPPADSPPGDLLITMVKETVILYKKEFRKMKKKSRLKQRQTSHMALLAAEHWLVGSDKYRLEHSQMNIIPCCMVPIW